MRGVEAEPGEGVLCRTGGRKKRSREVQDEEDVAERRRERAAGTKKKAREQPEEGRAEGDEVGRMEENGQQRRTAGGSVVRLSVEANDAKTGVHCP